MSDSAASGVQIPDDLAQVGYVAGAYGLRGALRITPFSPDADALLNVKTWWLDKPSLRPVSVRTAKFHSGDVVATLGGLDEREAAEALKGASVQVSRQAFPELPDDEYYWSDLIGMDAVNLQGDALGKVTDMMHNGAQSILRVTPVPAGETLDKVQERLIPFVDQFVKTVDLAARTITVDWGLDY